jgi:hypothetical protein
MDQLGVDIGFLMETKLMGGIFTRHLLGYNVLASTTTSPSSGEIAIFWRGNISYEVKETRVWGPNIISLHLMMGSIRFFVVGCYIPPSDQETLACINKAWQECPKGAHPILVGDLNLNLWAPHRTWWIFPGTSANARGIGSGGGGRGGWGGRGDGSPLSATTS